MHVHSYIFIIPQIICILRANGFPFCVACEGGDDYDLILAAWEHRPNEFGHCISVT